MSTAATQCLQEVMQFLYTFMMDAKGPSLQVPSTFYLSLYISQASLHHIDKMMFRWRTECLYTHTNSASKHMSLGVWKNTCIFHHQHRLLDKMFFASVPVPFGMTETFSVLVAKGAFLKDDCRFEVAIAHYGFCWVTLSNYLWCPQRKGDSYS